MGRWVLVTGKARLQLTPCEAYQYPIKTARREVYIISSVDMLDSVFKYKVRKKALH